MATAVRISEKLVKKLSEMFIDFKGLYHYGSRINNTNRTNSDYDFILIFENTILCALF